MVLCLFQFSDNILHIYCSLTNKPSHCALDIQSPSFTVFLCVDSLSYLLLGKPEKEIKAFLLFHMHLLVPWNTIHNQIFYGPLCLAIAVKVT